MHQVHIKFINLRLLLELCNMLHTLHVPPNLPPALLKMILHLC